MATSRITPVILCGGSGTRLWPRSRASKPKPFLSLVEQETLFQQALSRCADAASFDRPVIVTGARHLDHVEGQLGGAPAQVIVEPEAKNTAAAIALAALRLPQDSVMLVCPSDHHIGDCDAFTAAARAAGELATQGWLVSFGIEPTFPETGFGYLKRGEAIGANGFKVEQFVEKPDLARAQSYLASGAYAWNGGIFAFAVGDFLAELDQHRPDIAQAAREAVANGQEQGQRFYPDAAAFARIEGESVDYAVMENTQRAAMIPVSMNWSDIGNWQALHQVLGRDEHGNAARGPAELVDCTNVMVDSDGPKVHVIGLSDVIVVVDGNDIVVTSASGVQKVGKLSGAVNQ